MNIAKLLEEYSKQGIYLYLEDKKLKYRAYQLPPTDEMKKRIGEYKPQIIDYLSKAQTLVNDSNDDIPTFELSTRPNLLPLSFAQQRLWFIDQLGSGSLQYNVTGRYLNKGTININAFKNALHCLLERHEVLRTHYSEVNGEAHQVVVEDFELPLNYYDLEKTPIQCRVDEAKIIMRQEAEKPFNLSADLMLRVALIKLAEDKHLIFYTMHHIASDGWSRSILQNELIALYKAFSNELTNPLPPIKVQYADYAVWQRSWLQGDTLTRKLEYWKTQLAEIPVLHSLPLDHPRPEKQNFSGKIVHQLINKKQTKLIRSICQEHQVTLFMFLQTAYAVLLSRYSNQTDIVMGAPIAGRTASEIEPLIGFFVNTLVLRTDLSNNPTFSELLKLNKEFILDAFANQHVPFEVLVEEMRPERNLSYTPITQVSFILQNNERGAFDQQNFSKNRTNDEKLLSSKSVSIKFDLGLTVNEIDDELSLGWSYNDTLFKESTISRMADNFRVLIQAIIKNLTSDSKYDLSINALDLLSEKEKRIQILDWNTATKNNSTKPTLHELFEAQVKLSPESIALTHQTEIGYPLLLSYNELNKHANQLARYLLTLNLKANGFIGVYLNKSLDMVVSILACLKAGLSYVPLDPKLPQSRINYMIKDSGLKYILTECQLAQAFTHDQNLKLTLLDESSEQWRDCNSVENLTGALSRSSNELAYLIYTSGSTGQPKGVMTTHSGAVNYLNYVSNSFKISNKDKILQIASLSFDASVRDIFGPLINGAQVIFESEQIFNDPTKFLNAINLHRISAILSIVPSLLKVVTQQKFKPLNYSFLKTILLSGEPLSKQLCEELHVLFGSQLKLVNQYGPTENTMTSSYHIVKETSQVREIELIGEVIPNVRAYTLDQSLIPVPLGANGELYLAGAGLAQGYLNRASLTAEKFVPDPFSDTAGERMYKTGDLVRYCSHLNSSKGVLEFVSRTDNQVKINGIRIELGEIEYALRKNDSIKDAVVCFLSDNSGGKKLVAYIVSEALQSLQETQPESGSALKNKLMTEFKTQLGKSLPDYMIPKVYIFLETLPLTANGKIDRKALPNPDEENLQKELYIEPTNQREKMLHEIWSKLLNISSIGIHDNFFALGGHSLSAISLVSLVRQKFDVELSLQDLFTSPTIASLSERIMQINGEQLLPSIEKVDRTKGLALSFSQQRLWFIDQLGEGSVQYNMPGRILLKGAFNKEAFCRALHALIMRHEVLRTRFEVVNNTPQQIIQEDFQLPLTEQNISNLSESRKQQKLQQLIDEESNKTFDLRKDLMLRVQIVELSEEAYVIIYTMHHIASDRWSRKIFQEELTILFEAFRKGQSNPLNPLPIQYADYSAWQREWLSGEIFEEQLSYWKQQLANIPVVHNLPLDSSRPRQQTFKGQRIYNAVCSKATNRIKKLCNQHDVTLFMFLQTAFALLISRYSNEGDVIIGSPIAGRNHNDVEPLIGFFVNTLVFRTKLSPGMTFNELLSNNKKMILEALKHQHIPFEMLVEELQPERHLSHNPLTQISFLFESSDINTGNSPNKASLNTLETEKVPQQKPINTKFELGVTISENDNSLSIGWSFNDSLFTRQKIANMANNFNLLLNEIILNLEQKDVSKTIESFKIVATEEKSKLLSNENSKYIEPTGCLFAHQRIDKQAEINGDKIALTHYTQSGDSVHLSYAQLNHKANQLANQLIDSGVTIETKVAVSLTRSPNMIIALLAVLKAGGCYLPLDPKLPINRQSYMLKDSGVNFVLTESNLGLKQSLDSLALNKSQPIFLYLDDNPQLENYSSQSPIVNLHAQNLAYIIYTSGSTGKPKGVTVNHFGWSSLAESVVDLFKINSTSRALQFSSLSFDAATFEIVTALPIGATLCLISESETKDPKILARMIQNQRISYSVLTPAVLNLLTNECLESVITLITAGETIAKEIADRLSKQRRLFNAYGPTETTVCATAGLYQDSYLHIGKSLKSTTCFVLNQSKYLVPKGVIGELCVGGAQLARGYLDKPGLTAEKFIPNPFSKNGGERLYTTGDLVRYLSDGNLEFIGRVDHQIKIRGLRVELGEIESILLQHKQVTDAVVLAKQTVNNDTQLIAYVVADVDSEGVKTNSSQRSVEAKLETQLKDYLSQSLPDYMIPMVYLFLDKIPLTNNGKVDKKSLPKLQQNESLASQYLAPRDTVESTLCQLWETLLKIDRVGINDNFFALGGHSLLATRLVSAIREELSIELALRELFEFPTIAQLRKVIAKDRKDILLPPIKIVSREQRLPLSYAQQRLWFIDQLEQGSVQYNIPGRFLLKGEFKESAFKAALQDLLERHEVLRTNFTTQSGEAHQVIKQSFKLPYRYLDLSALDKKEQRAQIQHHMQQEAETPFSLSNDLMLRVRLLHLSAEVHIVLYTMHHIASDGWSMRIFQQDLNAFYEARFMSQESPLLPLKVQYADYALWQRQWLQGETLTQQLSYWQSQLVDLPRVHNLPLDKPRPSQQSFTGKAHRQLIDSNMMTKIQANCEANQVTLFMFLQTAFALLVGRYSSQRDVVIGSPVAGRIHQDIEGLIGFFINTLVIRTPLTSGLSFSELLQINKEIILNGYAYQHIPFEMLVDELKPERHLSHNPLTQILFVLQNNETGLFEQPIENQAKSDSNRDRNVSIKYDLELVATESPAGLSIGWLFNDDLFEFETISRLAANYEELLKNILISLESPANALTIDELELITVKEKQQLLFDYTNTQTSASSNQCIQRLFEQQVEKTPAAIAIKDKQKSLTFTQLNQRANQLGHYLIDHGVKIEQPIGIYLKPSTELLIALLGILKSGACAVILDPKISSLRIDYIIDNNDIELVIYNKSENSNYPFNKISTITNSKLDELEWVSLDSTYSQIERASINPSLSLSPLNLINLTHTINSKGQIENLYLSHLAITKQIDNKTSQFKDEQYLLTGTGYDSNKLTIICFEVLISLIKGKLSQTLPLIDSNANIPPKKIPNDLSKNLPLYIFDQNQKLCPIGVYGEICLYDSGYIRSLSSKERTPLERLIPNFLSGDPGTRLYRTGVLARRQHNQSVEILKTEYKSAWESLSKREAAQLEKVLIQNKMIKEIIFSSQLSKSANSGTICCISLVEQSNLNNNDLTLEIRTKIRNLNQLSKIPNKIHILKDIPLTNKGKTDHTALRTLIDLQELKLDYVKPNTDIETVLVKIWQNILGVKQVGVTDNYFALGGDSIRSISIVSQAKENNIEFSVKDLFETPTIRALAEAIETGRLSTTELVEIESFALLSEKEMHLINQRHDMEIIEDAFPLSMMQQGMVVLAIRYPHLNVYENLQIYRFSDWQLEAFEKALQHLMNKHPMLKSIYDFAGERPLQLVVKNKAPDLDIVDISNFNKSEQKSAINQWKHSERTKGIDTSQGVWRATIHLLPEGHFLFGMFIHHALWDGWSLESFVTELYSTYQSIRINEIPDEYQKLPSYNQFINLEQQALASVQHREFWLNSLQDANLPWWTGRAKSASERIVCRISTQNTNKLITLANLLGVQEKSLWCSIYLTLLNIINGSDKTIGPVISQGRPEIPGGDKMVGVFLNALPAAISIKNKSWRDLIIDTEAMLVEQQSFRHFPLAEMQNLTGLDFSGSLFNYTNWHVYYQNSNKSKNQHTKHTNLADNDNLVPDKVDAWAETNYLFSVNVHKNEEKQQHIFIVDVDPKVFDQDFQKRIQVYVAKIIEAMVSSSDSKIEKNLLLERVELNQLLFERNQTQTEFPGHHCFHQIFEQQVDLHPNAIAVKDAHLQINYRTLNARANQLAHYLITQGVGPEVAIGIAIPRKVELLIAIIAVLKAGGFYVPLDVNLPVKRLVHLIDDSGAEIVLTLSPEDSISSAIDSLRKKSQHIVTPKSFKNIILQNNNVMSSFQTTNPNTLTAPGNLAYLIYTSGSTGKPKGVQISHRGLVNYASYASQKYFTDQMGAVVSTSLSFDATVTTLLCPLTCGKQVYLIEQNDGEIDSLKEFILNSQHPHVFKVTPAHLEALKISMPAQVASKLSHHIVIGGEQLNNSSLAFWRQNLLPNATYVNEYGPTESVVGCIEYSIDKNELTPEFSNQVPIGRLIQNSHCYVLDVDLEIVPKGVIGELYLSGVGLARSYKNQSQLTAERFLPNPYGGKSGSRLYSTSDLVRYLPDGNLEFIGRKDEQVKIRGYRIELAEIENILTQHELVEETCVTTQGEQLDNQQLIAYLVLTDKSLFNDQLTEEQRLKIKKDLILEAKKHLGQSLPDYMIPKIYLFVERIPLTLNGKVDRKALPKPQKSDLQLESYVAPRDETEAALCEIWQSLFNIEKIGIFDDFFALGGNSLLAMRLVSAVRQAYQVELPLRIFFEKTTINDLAPEIISNLFDKKLMENEKQIQDSDDIEEVTV